MISEECFFGWKRQILALPAIAALSLFSLTAQGATDTSVEALETLLDAPDDSKTIGQACRPADPTRAFKEWRNAQLVSARVEDVKLALAQNEPATASALSSLIASAQRAVLDDRAADVLPELIERADRARAAASYRTEATIRGVIGLALSSLGRDGEARSAFERSVAAAQADGGASDIAAQSLFNLANLGLTSRSLGADGDARSRGTAAIGGSLDQSEQTEQEIIENEAEVLRDQLIGRFNNAADQAEAANDSALAARARLNAARLSLVGEDGEGAEDSLARAVSNLGPSNPTSDLALLRVAVADAYAQLSQSSPDKREAALKAAAAQLFIAIEEAQTSENVRAETFARGVLGRVYILSGDAGNALTATRQALDLSRTDAEDTLFQWRGQLGEVYAGVGRTEEALELYQAAIKDVENVRSSLSRIDPITGRSLFRTIVEPIYLGYASLLIDKADGVEAQSFLQSARNTLDSLKAVELQQYFQDDCVTGLFADRLTQAPEDVAILYPVLLADRVALIVESGGAWDLAEGDASPAQVARAASQLRSALRRVPGADADYKTPAKFLYSVLIEPVEDYLRASGVETIVFAPDGPLRGVPLNVLMNEDEEFLVERYATTTAISASLINQPQSTTKTDRRALYASFGLPRLGFSALNNVAPEIDAARKIFTGPAPLTNDDFTEPALSDALAQTKVDIVHFATHATFGGRTDNSFLLASGDEQATGEDDGRLTIEEFEAMINRARIAGGDIELITLSACETAAGDDQSVLGLAGVAYRSGARSVFASLWAINDASTASFVPEFYTAMSGGQSKAKSLQDAQRSFLEGGQYAHPYYWSPFILLGEWN